MKKIKKESIANIIQEAITKEELAIPLYADHINNALFWSGFTNETKKKLIENLGILESDSEFHALSLKAILKKYA